MCLLLQSKFVGSMRCSRKFEVLLIGGDETTGDNWALLWPLNWLVDWWLSKWLARQVSSIGRDHWWCITTRTIECPEWAWAIIPTWLKVLLTSLIATTTTINCHCNSAAAAAATTLAVDLRPTTPAPLGIDAMIWSWWLSHCFYCVHVGLPDTRIKSTGGQL